MATIRWDLEEWLESNGLTRYQLAQAMPGNMQSWLTTLYRMRDPKRLDLGTVATIISTLRQLTGLKVDVRDLLSYHEDAPPAGKEPPARKSTPPTGQ